MVNQPLIKEDYKETELGWIPKDWKVGTLGEVSSFINDGTHHTPNYVDQGVPFYSVENVTSNDFINTRQISLEEHNKLVRRCKPEQGDILLTRIGTLGKTKLIDWNINASIYVSLALIKLKKGINSEYIYSYTKSNLFVNEIIKRSLTNAVPQKINMNEINAVKIILPRREKEQQAIASVLSDMDELIESFEEVIDKKKKIKQGTMQQLLTGKKRLKGFTGEWYDKKVADFGEIITGGTPSTINKSYWNGNVPWVTPTDITMSKSIYKTSRSLTREGLKKVNILPQNTLLVTCIASIGKNVILRKTGACNQQINAVIPNQNNNVDFLYYLMENNKAYLLSKAGITATNIISKAIFSEIVFKIPNYKEQKAIASILSDMDSEIELLEEKLEKYEQMKEGMMQQLLTGRIRLV